VQRDPKSGREDRFILRGSGGDRTSLERDWENFGHWWGAYPYADDFVNVLHQSATRRMEAGESHVFVNLFYASSDRKPLACGLRRVGVSAVEIVKGSGAERSLVGEGAFSAKGVSVQAALFALNAEGFALCEGTEMSAGAGVFASDRPVSISYDLKAGDGVVEAKAGARVSLVLGRAGLVAVDGKVVRGEVLETLKNGDRRVSFEVPAGRHTLSATPAQSRLPVGDLPAWREPKGRASAAAKAPRLRRVWSFEAGSGVRAADGAGDRVVCGTADGRVLALKVGRRAAPVWAFRAKGPVNSVRVTDLDGDGRTEVLAGSDDRHLYVLDQNGKVRWRRKFEKYVGTWDRYARNAEVARVEAEDLDGDGRREILTAVSDRQLHCLDADGQERWSFMIYGIFDPLCVADVNGDGRPEVVGGPGRITCNGTCYVLDGDGRQINIHPTDGWASMLPSCAVAPMGEGVLIAAGTSRGTLYAFDPSQRPMGVRWRRDLGDEVTALALGDVDGDGLPEVAAGSSCFYIYLFGSDGRERWRRNLRAGVRAVLCADLDGDGRPEVAAGCDDGRVAVFGADGTERASHRGEGFGCLRAFDGALLAGDGGTLRALVL
jgi:outer membrane protein assembly factor BamB